MNRILVVEDDPKMLKLLALDLEVEGYTVFTAADGASGLEKARDLRPDLILLDVMLPEISGYEVCRTLRSERIETPILFLTARGHETDKVVGLGFGADDYITKPFSRLELQARVKAHLRRKNKAPDKVAAVEFDGIRVDFRRFQATKGRKDIALTPKEFQILELLVRHKGEVVTKKMLQEEIWGHSETLATRTVDNQVITLRQKLSRDPESYIATVHGVGYKFTGR